MFNLKKILILMLVTNTVFIYADSIEEIVVTGSLIKDQSDTILPAEIITEGEYKNYNITSVAEISKYLNISSGSHFQTNALDGVDQGMNSLTLRGLNHASTLVLINSKRHTQAGTPSNQGEGYTDINIIPEIALRKIEILKDGATSTYGSDAVAGVVNFITYKEYEGLKISINKQSTTNYDMEKTIKIIVLYLESAS
jgi:iron complex outermembrane receptor protein